MSVLFLAISAFCLACIAFLWACYDFLVYRKRVRELQQRTLAAQRSLRQLGDLANEVAHEIKNPITAILCSAETLDLLIGDQLEDIHRKSLLYIKEYGDNLLRLVSDFLDVSRAETGKIEARQEPTKVKPVIDAVIGLLESNAYKKRIVIKQFLCEEEIAALTDPKHFKQVLFNLLHNAIKFTDEHGEIHVSVRKDFPNPMLKVSVQDNGVGISEEVQKALFDPYYCGHSSNESGVGLGLPLCKSLVELNGGEISVKSTPGVGTEFEFSLRWHFQGVPERPKGPVTEALEVGEPLTGQKFLVVDEHLGSREALSRLIEAWGGMVDRVAMAVDAVEALERNQYDAVMIDDSVDGVYAHELARIIRKDLKQESTTIIVATNDEVDVNVARQSGVDQCIAKPLNGRTLLDSLLNSGKYTVTH